MLLCLPIENIVKKINYLFYLIPKVVDLYLPNDYCNKIDMKY